MLVVGFALGVVLQAEADADWLTRRFGVWVMGRSWYDLLRAELVSADLERTRAAAHLELLVAGGFAGPCPACGALFGEWPLPGAVEFAEHVRVASDPWFREPSPGDRLLGRPLRVVAGGSRPRLVVVDG